MNTVSINIRKFNCTPSDKDYTEICTDTLREQYKHL